MPRLYDGFADRARREADRFRLATDSEYWVCFCFRTAGAAAAFARAAGADGRYVPGASLPQANAAPRGRFALAARSTRSLGIFPVLATHPVPDPLANVPGTGDLEADSVAELAALLAALTAAPDPAPAPVLDSPHWVTAWWPSRHAKNGWLTVTGVCALGDKYVDGHQAAAILGITTKGRLARTPAGVTGTREDVVPTAAGKDALPAIARPRSCGNGRPESPDIACFSATRPGICLVTRIRVTRRIHARLGGMTPRDHDLPEAAPRADATRNGTGMRRSLMPPRTKPRDRTKLAIPRSMPVPRKQRWR